MNIRKGDVDMDSRASLINDILNMTEHDLELLFKLISEQSPDLDLIDDCL